LAVYPGDERPALIRLPDWVSNDDDAKQALGQALGTATRITKPLMVAMIQSTWVISKENDPDRLTLHEEAGRPRVMPRDHPNREEQLFVIVLDTEVSHAHYAPILRHRRRPPKLGKWQSYTDGEITGRLAAPLREALR
jgi:hypothetical protein